MLWDFVFSYFYLSSWLTKNKTKKKKSSTKKSHVNELQLLNTYAT